MQKHMAASASNAAEVLEVLTALFTGNMRSLQSSSFSRARRLSKMEPGYTTIPHQHRGNEEFFMISGEAVDNDGTVYRAGDLVLMKDGTEHCSYTEKGCVILVYLEEPEASL